MSERAKDLLSKGVLCPGMIRFRPETGQLKSEQTLFASEER